MKSSKIKPWKIIWIVGIYTILAIILYLVILYKVKWEHKDLNTYLYFYDCSNSICTSTTSQNDYYSKVLCEEGICPYITNIIDNNIILEKENQSWIYNYIDGSITNNSYINYRYIGNDTFIVTDNLDKQGIIDIQGNIIAESEYEYIENYDNNLVSYKENNIYKIKNIQENEIYDININFEHIVLINDKIFAGKQDNVYKIYSYNNLTNEINSNTYNYIYSYNDIIFVINNKKIDILNSDLSSILLMKIDTFYEYMAEKERDSLDLYSEDEFVYFKVYNSDNNYIQYTYNTSTNELFNLK